MGSCTSLPDFILIFDQMARILAFDYGTKRIGIAVTDPLQIIATGLDTIHPKDIVDYLKKYLLTEQVEAFVIGEPKQMDGSPSESAPHVKGFSTILKKNFPTIPLNLPNKPLCKADLKRAIVAIKHAWIPSPLL